MKIYPHVELIYKSNGDKYFWEHCFCAAKSLFRLILMRVNAKVRESLLLIIAFNDFLLINFLMSGFLPTELLLEMCLEHNRNDSNQNIDIINCISLQVLSTNVASNIKHIKVQIMSNFDLNISVLTPGPGRADACQAGLRQEGKRTTTSHPHHPIGQQNVGMNNQAGKLPKCMLSPPALVLWVFWQEDMDLSSPMVVSYGGLMISAVSIFSLLIWYLRKHYICYDVKLHLTTIKLIKCLFQSSVSNWIRPPPHPPAQWPHDGSYDLLIQC